MSPKTRVVRAVLALAVIGVGWVAVSFALHRRQQAAEDRNTAEASAPLVPYHFTDLIDGRWKMHDSQFSIRMRSVSANEAAEFLNRVPANLTEPISSEATHDARILEIFAAFGQRQAISPDVTRHDMQRGGFRAVAYSKVFDNVERFVAASILMAGDEEQHPLIDVTGLPPKPLNDNKPSTTQLEMPVPPDATVIATRLDSHDQICGVLATSIRTPASLEDFLRASGWTVSPAPPELLQASSSQGAWICQQRDAILLVTLMHGEGDALMVVVRVPDDHPTPPPNA